jgi:hypothetical protein
VPTIELAAVIVALIASGALGGASAVPFSTTATSPEGWLTTFATDWGLCLSSSVAEGGVKEPLVPAEAAGIVRQFPAFGFACGLGFGASDRS